MDLVVEEIFSMIPHTYEADFHLSSKNVIIRYKQGGQGKNKDEKKVKIMSFFS